MLVAEDEALVLTSRALAGALQEDRGDLFFTISVENRESPLYLTLSTLEKKEGGALFNAVISYNITKKV